MDTADWNRMLMDMRNGRSENAQAAAHQAIQAERRRLISLVEDLTEEVGVAKTRHQQINERLSREIHLHVNAAADVEFWRAEAKRLAEQIERPTRFREIVEKVLGTTEVESIVTLVQVEKLTEELVAALEANGAPSA